MLELILPWRCVHKRPVLLPFQAEPHWRVRKEETIHSYILDSGVKSLLLYCVSPLCPKGSKTFLHFQLYLMNGSSLLRTKVFEGTAAGKGLQESTISGAVTMLLDLYETLLLGFDRKKEEFKMLFWVCIVSNLYILRFSWPEEPPCCNSFPKTNSPCTSK